MLVRILLFVKPWHQKAFKSSSSMISSLILLSSEKLHLLWFVKETSFDINQAILEVILTFRQV